MNMHGQLLASQWVTLIQENVVSLDLMNELMTDYIEGRESIVDFKQNTILVEKLIEETVEALLVHTDSRRTNGVEFFSYINERV